MEPNKKVHLFYSEALESHSKVQKILENNSLSKFQILNHLLDQTAICAWEQTVNKYCSQVLNIKPSTLQHCLHYLNKTAATTFIAHMQFKQHKLQGLSVNIMAPCLCEINQYLKYLLQQVGSKIPQPFNQGDLVTILLNLMPFKWQTQ